MYFDFDGIFTFLGIVFCTPLYLLGMGLKAGGVLLLPWWVVTLWPIGLIALIVFVAGFFALFLD